MYSTHRTHGHDTQHTWTVEVTHVQYTQDTWTRHVAHMDSRSSTCVQQTQDTWTVHATHMNTTRSTHGQQKQHICTVHVYTTRTQHTRTVHVAHKTKKQRPQTLSYQNTLKFQMLQYVTGQYQGHFRQLSNLPRAKCHWYEVRISQPSQFTLPHRASDSSNCKCQIIRDFL